MPAPNSPQPRESSRHFCAFLTTSRGNPAAAIAPTKEMRAGPGSASTSLVDAFRLGLIVEGGNFEYSLDAVGRGPFDPRPIPLPLRSRLELVAHSGDLDHLPPALHVLRDQLLEFHGRIVNHRTEKP